MSTVLITGGTGLVGTRLTQLLVAKGYDVIIVSRHAAQNNSAPKVTYAKWDIEKQTIDADAIAKADHIIHLAGAGVAEKRWTDKRKKEIVDSRTQSSALIVKVLKENSNHVKAVISASAIGWYGADPATHKDGFEETDEPETDFLGETCRLWEESIEPVTQLGKRLVKLRTGIVLGKGGGALQEFMKPIKFGVAAILGSGNQVVSWIHIDDLCNIYIAAIENPNIQGCYNAVAPSPVTNKQLTVALAKEMRGKFYVPIHVPSFVLKIVLGEMSIEVLKSARVSCNKIKTAGFSFGYPAVDDALKQLLK